MVIKVGDMVKHKTNPDFQKMKVLKIRSNGIVICNVPGDYFYNGTMTPMPRITMIENIEKIDIKNINHPAMLRSGTTKEIKMTKAEQMKSALNHEQMTWTDLLIEADEIGEAYEQDYGNEITWFEFLDNSVAAFFGKSQEIITYACRD